MGKVDIRYTLNKCVLNRGQVSRPKKSRAYTLLSSLKITSEGGWLQKGNPDPFRDEGDHRFSPIHYVKDKKGQRQEPRFRPQPSPSLLSIGLATKHSGKEHPAMGTEADPSHDERMPTHFLAYRKHASLYLPFH